jgi:hypothetical protein
MAKLWEEMIIVLIGYYIWIHGVSVTMLLNNKIYDLARFLTTYHYFNFGVNTKNNVNVKLSCKPPCHLVIDNFAHI